MDQRTCLLCGAVTNRPKYCSRKCSDTARYESNKARVRARYAEDADYRTRILDRQRNRRRALGIPPTTRLPRAPICTVEDCGERHLAKGFCRSHYRKELWRTKSGEYRRNRSDTVDREIMARVDVRGSGEFRNVLVRCTVLPSAGLWVWCSPCGTMMGCPDSEWDRVCVWCGSSLQLNEDEARWVIYEALSTSPLRRAG